MAAQSFDIIVIGSGPGGYVTAIEQGYYESAGLDVTLLPSDPAAPMPVDRGDAEFVVSWVPAVLVARERDGSDLVDIAQIAQRSGTLSLAWRESAITVPDVPFGMRFLATSTGVSAVELLTLERYWTR